jgi:hypothetical protein
LPGEERTRSRLWEVMGTSRKVVETAEFERWSRSLNPELRANVQSAIERIAEVRAVFGEDAIALRREPDESAEDAIALRREPDE